MQDQKIRALLVEDVASDAKMISRMLKQVPENPFRLTTVNRLGLALKKIHRFKYDIVLLDLGLPDSKGIDTFKSLYSECPDVPVVIFTILGSESIGVEAISLGAQDYLVKGTSDERILTKSIRYALERKNLELNLKHEKEELATTLTELRKAKEDRAQLAEIVEQLDYPVFSATLDGIVMNVNRGIEKVYGYTVEEIKGKPVSVFIPPERMWEMNWILDKIKNGEAVHNFETVRMKKDGSLITVLLSINPMKDLSGTINGTAISVNDISERKKLEDELRISEQRLRFHLENSPLAVIEWDENFVVKRWSSEAERIFGWKREEVLGKRIDTLNIIYEDDIPEINHILRRLADGELSTIVVSGRIYTKWGDVRECMWFDSVLLDKNSKMISVLSLVQDITIQKQLERELSKHVDDLNAANRELESFSYSVAHDLRNPLEVIGGFVDLIFADCRAQLNENCFDYLKRIKSGKERMSSIIDDILALSKISRQEIKIEDLDLSEMAHLSANELAAANPGRRVGVKIEEGLKVRADARLMSVTIGNLLNNAWKYTSKVENPQVEFGAINRDGQKVYYVKDNGAGFDMKLAEKLFVPFQRLHSDKDFKGTGIGLAIVERAISRHGGKVWAQGEVGKGATFYFTLGGTQ